MNNEQKADEMIQSYCVPIKHWIKKDLVSAMEWKDEQYEQILIDKDCEIERLELIIEELKKGGKL